MKTRNGYLVDSRGRFVHREISKECDGPIPEGYVVHHCDGDKLNNLPINLVQIPSGLHDEIHERWLFERPSKYEILNRLLWEYHLRKSKVS